MDGGNQHGGLLFSRHLYRLNPRGVDWAKAPNPPLVSVFQEPLAFSLQARLQFLNGGDAQLVPL